MSYKRLSETELRKMNKKFLEKHFERRIKRASMFDTHHHEPDTVKAIKTSGKKKKRRKK